MSLRDQGGSVELSERTFGLLKAPIKSSSSDSPPASNPPTSFPLQPSSTRSSREPKSWSPGVRVRGVRSPLDVDRLEAEGCEGGGLAETVRSSNISNESKAELAG